MSNPSPAGWRLPAPAGWPTWSVGKRVFVVISLAALLAAGYLGVRVIEEWDPDFTVTMLGCSAVDRIATTEFAITNERNTAQDARVSVDYSDGAGRDLGHDTVKVPAIRPGETVRKSQAALLHASAATIRCEINGIYSDDTRG